MVSGIRIRSGLAGFTLVEVLVTLTIVGLMATLLLPRLSKTPALAQPEVVRFLVSLQADAARTRKPVSVVLHGRTLRASNGREFVLAEGDALRSLRPGDIGYLGGQHVVTFFTDGSSTAGEWLFKGVNLNVLLRFSPFATRIGYATAAATEEGGAR